MGSGKGSVELDVTWRPTKLAEATDIKQHGHGVGHAVAHAGHVAAHVVAHAGHEAAHAVSHAGHEAVDEPCAATWPTRQPSQLQTLRWG